MTRTFKKIFYGIFYLLIFSGIIFLIYSLYFKPAPSCFDGIQDNGEQGIDCGGPCAKVCTPSDMQPISIIGDVQTFVTSQNYVTFLAKISNPNKDFAAKSFDYSFNIYDASGSQIQSFSGSSFIYGGEVKYLLVPNQEVPSSTSKVMLVVSNPQWAKSSDYGSIPKFVLNGIQTSIISQGVIGVNGSITNDDISTFSKIVIIAILNDSNGNAVGSSETEVDNLPANQTANFSIIYPAVQNVDFSSTKVYAYGEK